MGLKFNNRHIKRIALAALSVTLMVSLFAGCGQKSSDSGDKANAATPNGSTNTAQTELPIVKQPIKLSFFIASRVSDSLYNQDTPVFKELTKRTNIQFDFITSDRTSMTQKFKLMIASGDYPDIVAGSIKDFNKYGSNGAFVPLNDLIHKNAPNVTKYVINDQSNKMQTIAADGNFYCVPMLSAVRTAEVYALRKDWLDRLQLKVPVTIDDWYNVLKAFKEKDANGNGDPNDEIPLYFQKGTYHFNFADAWGIDINKDYGYWMMDNGTPKFGPVDPRTRDYLTTMNKWYTEGLIDKEFLSRGADAVDYMLLNNKGGATNDWINNTAAYNDKETTKKIQGFRMEVVPPPVLKAGDAPKTYRQQTSVVSLGWAISSKNKYPQETMKLFNYVYGDEGQELCNFGIENDTYTKAADGSIKYTDKVLTSADGTAKALWRIGAQPLIGFRQDPKYERLSRGSKDTENQLFNYVDKNYFRDPFPSLTLTADEQEKFNEKSSTLYTYVDEMLTKFIVGAAPLSDWDSYVAQVNKLGLKDLENIQKTAYARYKDLAKK